MLTGTLICFTFLTKTYIFVDISEDAICVQVRQPSIQVIISRSNPL